jgi:UTP--glucose-1-phosphate uridylyltransferase
VIFTLLLRAIDEAVEADIPHVILVLAPDSVEPVYSRLITSLVKRSPPAPVTLDYCVQPEPRSTGDALLRAEELVGGQPFAVLFPDDVIIPSKRTSRPRLLRRMMRLSQERDGASIVAVTPVPRRKMSDCGVVEVQPGDGEERVYPITRLVENPPPEDPVYDLYDQAGMEGATEVPLIFGIAGRYLLPPDIFAALRELQPAGDSQLLLTDALEHFRRAGHALYALAFEEEREDLGEVVGEVEEWGGYTAKEIKVE